MAMIRSLMTVVVAGGMLGACMMSMGGLTLQAEELPAIEYVVVTN